MYEVLIGVTAVVMALSLWGATHMAVSGADLRTSHGEGRQPGPLPGYAYHPEQSIESSGWMDAAGLKPFAVEAFHTPVRNRVVVTVTPTKTWEGATPDLLETATAQLLEKTRAHVVVVEITSSPEGPSRSGHWTAIASRDGRGWTGAETGLFLVIEEPLPGELA